MSKASDEITAFAALTSRLSADTVNDICSLLKTDKHFKNTAAVLSEHLYENFNDKLSAVRFINKYSIKTAQYLILTKDCFSLDTEIIKNAVSEITNGAVYTLSQLDINGNDLSLMGIKGKEISEKLNMLLNKVILGEVPNSKEELKKLI